MGMYDRDWYQDEAPKGGWRWYHDMDWVPVLMILGVLAIVAGYFFFLG